MTSEHVSCIHQLVAERAATMPDSIAIVDTDGLVYTYAQFQAAIIDGTQYLRENGIESGDRIVLIAENCLTTAVFIFAASAVGAVIIPINARMVESELKQVVEHAMPRITLFTVGVSKEAANHAEKANAKTHRTAYGEFAIAIHAMERSVLVEAENTAVILYTTGTTGAPKGVMLSHDNLLFAGRTSARLREMAQEDRLYGVLPMTHVFGLASMLLAACHAGASVLLESRFQSERVYEALHNGISVFPAVPQMHALVMQYASERGLKKLENSQLRYVSSGAAPLDPAWKRKAEIFYGLAMQNGYGMTESSAGICATSNTIGTADNSVGPALPGIEIRLDTSGAVSTDAGMGEILTRGPHVMTGYFRNSYETDKVIDSNGWLRTGDLGRIDRYGNLHVVGRCKELIIRGGFNVYPPEVEVALNDHPHVIQSAVIGRKLDNADEEIIAFVQCVDPDSLDTVVLTDFVSDRLVSYKRPSRIITTTELPVSASGKILKHKLLLTFARQLENLS